MSDQETVNISSHLPLMAQKQPLGTAVIVQRYVSGKACYDSLSFRELDEESNEIANGLEHIGIRRGVRTVLMVKPSLEFFSLTFALFKIGAVPVMVDPGMGIKNLKTCLAEAEPEAFIGIPKAHVARILFGWAKGTLKTLVTVGRRVFWGGTTLTAIMDGSNSSYIPALTGKDETAAILFTSGSTGVPKGAVYTHGVFDAQVGILRKDYGIEPGEKDLATFPLFALFGPALGMAAIIPDMDASQPAKADPSKIIAAVKDNQATNMFASPALIHVVGDYGAKNNVKLPSLKRVISAGAPANIEALRKFSAMLPDGVEIFPSYGATEALPVSFIGTQEQLGDTAGLTSQGAGVCVGRPVADVQVEIIKISDGPIPDWSDDLVLPQGEIGEITVKGPVVTKEYFHRPESTALSKITEQDTGDVRHRMGDLGYFDGKGRLWMCGRKSHRVVSGAETFFTIPCERIFDTHNSVRRTALVGVKKDGDTTPVLCVELNGQPGKDKKLIEKELLEIGDANDQTRAIKTVLFHKRFPVDVRHNAKIFREELTEWAAGELK